ncbi:hypothetical protein FHX70_000736 [Slackia isoflavoniconvertens]|nr:hypothetical protein [Slackia isoflavoniconvertens]
MFCLTWRSLRHQPVKVDGIYALTLPEDLEEDEEIELVVCLSAGTARAESSTITSLPPIGTHFGRTSQVISEAFS